MKYLDTWGKSKVTIAVCDRCHMKMALSDMVSDPNSPGLRVHPDCADQFDPYRLAPRQTEDITVFQPRPDADIGLATGVPIPIIGQPGG